MSDEVILKDLKVKPAKKSSDADGIIVHSFILMGTPVRR